MRVVKVLGAALAATFAFSAIVASGVSAHEFEASKVGLLLLTKVDVGLQLFTTLAGTVLCSAVKGTKRTTATKFETKTSWISFSGCTVNNGKVTAKPDEPIVGEYEFNANGSVTGLSAVTILASLAGLKCTVTIPAQGPLTTISYKNISASLVLSSSNVTGIETKAVGAGCGEAYGTSKTGTFVSTAITEADEGGTFSWK
jgi:hypothetical protein